MKKIIYILISLTIITSSLFSQEQDSLIQLYPGLGDTLDSFDRDYFEIFQNIEGFKYAVFYIRDDKYLVSKVTYSISSISKDTTFIQSLLALEDVRTRFDKIEIENNEKLENETEIVLYLTDGKEINGILRMFSKSSVYLILEDQHQRYNFQSNALRIPLVKIEQIKILGPSKVWSYTVYGLLFGLALFPINYLVGGYAYFTGLVLNPITGGLVGLIVGALSSSDEDEFTIEIQSDILKLKEYAKYYIRYDEELEEKYIEIE